MLSRELLLLVLRNTDLAADLGDILWKDCTRLLSRLSCLLWLTLLRLLRLRLLLLWLLLWLLLGLLLLHLHLHLLLLLLLGMKC